MKFEGYERNLFSRSLPSIRTAELLIPELINLIGNQYSDPRLIATLYN